MYSQNIMGIAPDGKYTPNGQDFWWDNWPSSTGNCWFKNTPFKGKEITTSSALPDCDGGKNPESSRGQGDPAAQGELIQCLVAIEQDNRDACPWFSTPPKPDAG
jgi:hypothetical protein